MHITPFGVEIWMNAWETRCTHNLAETCVASVTIAELLALAGRNDSDLSELLDLRMTYGAIEGSDRLRQAVARLYARQAPGNILITHGTIGANMLVHRTLVSPGDRVIAITPTYQQHTAIPASLGADLLTLPLQEADGWLPDLDRLAALADGGVKLIALTNPNNPTGALIPRAGLERIAEIARRHDAWVLCDEVYRGTDQDGSGISASMADLYEKGISTASTSKAFSLAGLRLGWIAAPEALLEQVMIHRDYDTISVGQIDDHFATIALENAPALLARSQHITRTNLALLAEWVAQEPRISWVRPASGTTAFLRYDLDMPSETFCEALLAETGVLFTPGSALGVEGYVRIGFANDTAVMKAGLPRVSNFLARRG